MKKIFWGIIVFVFLAFASYFWYKNKVEKSNDSIKIGAILPLTGNLSYLGEEEKNAILLLIDSLNRNSKQKIEVYFEDSKGTAKDGVTAYQSLKQKGVKAFFTSLTIVARSIAPLIDKNDDVQFAASIDPEITKEYKNTFQVYYNIADEVKMAVDYFSFLKLKKVSALYIQTPEDEIAINKYLKPLLQSKGIDFLSPETFSFADKSLKNQLLKLKSLNPDRIYTIDFGYMYPVMLTEAKEYDIREKIFGGLGMMTAPPMPVELTNEIQFVSSSFVVNPTIKYQQFKASYLKKYNKPSTFDGVYTYDAVNILVYLVKNNYKQEVLLNKYFDGYSGTIFIDTTKSAQVDLKLAKFSKTGEIIPVEFK